MTDVYDRANWPKPESNPLVQLLLSGEEWFSNSQLVSALGLSPNRALIASGTSFAKILRDDDSGIEFPDLIIPGTKINPSNSGKTRVFNRRALVFAAMRSETVNAAAFRDWAADRLAEEVRHG